MNWHAGDPSTSGLVLAAAYLILAAGCFLVARRQTGSGSREERGSQAARRITWNALGVALLAIAVERQLGLLNLLTASMRDRAMLDGDYATRGILQAEALRRISVVAAALCAGLTVATWRMGRCVVGLVVVTTGIVFYLTAKAVSLHAVDQVLFKRVHGGALGNWIELALTATAAVIIMLAGTAQSTALPRPADRV